MNIFSRYINLNLYYTIKDRLLSFYQICAKYIKVEKKLLSNRVKHHRDQRGLKKKPLYLLLGGKQAGKKNLIANSGLYFTKPSYFGTQAQDLVKEFQDYEWWFSEEAIIVDTMTHDKEVDYQNWKLFTKYLKRIRKRKPVNGIILSLAQADVMLYSHQQRQDLLQEISHYLRDLYLRFKIKVPVYIVLTHCDLIEGFNEYFNDLNKEEVNQIFGLTMPLAESKEQQSFPAYFSKAYTQLIQQLRHRVLWILDAERTARGRELVYAYPQQMQLFKKPLENFITELYGAFRYEDGLLLRGLYFTSTQQQGQPIDFLHKVMSKRFQLLPPKENNTKRLHERFFVGRIFHDIFLKEAVFLGENERFKKYRDKFLQSLYVILPSFALLGGVLFWQAYKADLNDFQQTKHSISSYQAYDNAYQHHKNTTTLLKMMSTLANNQQALTTREHFGQHFLFSSYRLRSLMDDSLTRVLRNQFMPKVAYQLESLLNSNISDQSLLYATVKAYLSFQANNSSDSSTLKAPLSYFWKNNLSLSNSSVSNLQYFLSQAISGDIDKLPLDHDLIQERRRQLANIIPAERAYGLLRLKSSIADLADLSLPNSIGSDFKQIFEFSQHKALVIPALYTKVSYEKVYNSYAGEIANEVTHDNQDIGLAHDQQNIRQALSRLYAQDYYQSWQTLLDHLRIRPADNLASAIKQLNVLKTKNSPLAELILLTYQNTQPVLSANSVPSQYFTDLNQFSENGNKDVQWQTIDKALVNLQTYLQNIANSPNPDMAAFKAAKANLNGADDAINHLLAIAKQAPQPLQRYLQELAFNDWRLVLSSAQRVMNNAWQDNVLSFYADNIYGRYPLRRHSNSPLSIEAFNHFFGKQGVLSKYINTYIMPFISVHHGQWRPNVVAEHDARISQSMLNLVTNVKHIQQQFFSYHPNQASLLMNITPWSLDADTVNMHLELGEHHLSYEHGPRFQQELTWPFASNAENISLTLNGFSHEDHTLVLQGPWALFKLFQRGHLENLGHSGNYLYNLYLGKHHLALKINSSANVHTLQLSNLSHLYLPKTINRSN